MTEAVSLTLLAVAGTLLGVAIGIIGTYFVSIRLASNHAKSLAGLCLRDSFAPEVVKLQSFVGEEPSIEIPRILEAAFEKHHMAANGFAFFLTKDEAKSFTEAWRKYCTTEDQNKTNFEQYLFFPEEAINRIYAILQFTKN
jgi:hypothetical protein